MEFNEKEWRKIRDKFLHQPYTEHYDGIELDDIKKCFCWLAEWKDVPPIIMEMLLSLEKRIDKLEENNETKRE